MPGGALVTLSYDRQLSPYDVSAAVAQRGGRRALPLIEVNDTGAGIAAGDLEHIFEPFFTTKEIGKGTGMGLSLVYGFVKQPGWVIEVASHLGGGTTFKIYLPRATGLDQTVAELQASSPVEGGHEVVLVVEDDALVRKYVVTQIEKSRLFHPGSG